MAVNVLRIPYKPLSRCSIDELAAQQQMNERRQRQYGGVMFARREDDSEKAAAREAILDLLTLDRKPEPLSVLTMPGLHWTFEVALMKRRDPHWRNQQAIERTRFTCVENDRFIYYSATTKMPGNKHCCLRTLDRPDYAERAMGQGVVDRFIFANVDDLIQSGESFDVAWLDYTGPLSIDRMKLIERFWRESVRDTLIVTSLKARWNKDTSLRIERHGGLIEWQRARLPGRVLHEIEYQDGSPMAQFAVSKSA